MTDKPAVTMREIRKGLGHTTPPEGLPEPTIRPTRYEVSCLPEDFPDADCWTITVEYRGRDRWAVKRGEARTLGADGSWSWGYAWQGGAREPVTDAEIDDYNAGYDKWLAAHRFDRGTALRLAREAAPLVTVMGRTPADMLRMAAAEGSR